MKLKAIYELWSWSCAVRFNENEEVSIIDDKDSEFMLIPDSKKYWTADPFLFKKDGQLYLFFEAFDVFKRKGLLGYRTIDNGSFGEINIIYESDSHLSFPFIYEDGESIYIIPESAKCGELFRLKCVSFPEKWEKEKVILTDTVVDTVRFFDGKTEYLITEKVDDTHVYDRVDLYYYENGELIECKDNPHKRDSSNARGAGAICSIKGKLIRPAQDCSESYGEKLNLNEITVLNKNCFQEKLIDSFTYKDIKLNEKLKIDGIHTYGKLGNVEVIDVRIPGRFNLRYTLGFFSKAIHRIFK